MSEKKYYLLSDDNCKYEGMTKEEILAAIQQAADEGRIKDIDTGFVTKLKELNRNQALQVWIGTQAEYNAIDKIVTNTLYIITDETHEADIEQTLKTIILNLEAYDKAIVDINTEQEEFRTNTTQALQNITLHFENNDAEILGIKTTQENDHKLVSTRYINNNNFKITVDGGTISAIFTFDIQKIGNVLSITGNLTLQARSGTPSGTQTVKVLEIPFNNLGISNFFKSSVVVNGSRYLSTPDVWVWDINGVNNKIQFLLTPYAGTDWSGQKADLVISLSGTFLVQ